MSYVRQHGGGTIAVSSQQGAANQIISSGADVAGIGGFSGRESEVSVSWLANAVQSGRVRWVLTSDAAGRGPGGDGRVGSSRAMAAVAATCKRVTVPTSSSSGTGTSTVSLYDCQGQASALRAAANVVHMERLCPPESALRQAIHPLSLNVFHGEARF